MNVKESRSMDSRKSTRILVAREASARDAGIASLAWRNCSPIEGIPQPYCYAPTLLPWASSADVETLLPAGVLPLHVHRRHRRPPRPPLDPVHHRLHRELRPLEHGLHPAVGHVADPSGHSTGTGMAGGIGPEEDALDEPGGEEGGPRAPARSLRGTGMAGRMRPEKSPPGRARSRPRGPAAPRPRSGGAHSSSGGS